MIRRLPSLPGWRVDFYNCLGISASRLPFLPGSQLYKVVFVIAYPVRATGRTLANRRVARVKVPGSQRWRVECRVAPRRRRRDTLPTRRQISTDRRVARVKFHGSHRRVECRISIERCIFYRFDSPDRSITFTTRRSPLKFFALNIYYSLPSPSVR